MNLSFFGEDIEERKDIIIALLVILFFGWLIYTMDWFSTKPEIAKLSNTPSAQTIADNSKNFTSNKRVEPSLSENKPPMVEPVQKEVAKITSDAEAAPIDTDAEAAPIDTDADGFFDLADQCPDVAGTNNGCPVDSDGDGVADDIDRCPNVIGVLQNQGCLLDTDGDGVPDIRDSCPMVAGILANGGCEEVVMPEPIDSDGDHIPDSEDQCPAVAGTENGCPADADGDGIADEKDRCPEVAGVTENSGCLLDDADADGVVDSDDKCPNIAGDAKSDGCPEEVKVTEAERKIIDEAISSVAFITGSSRLTRYSKGLLDKVSTILVKHSNYNLLIRGHTDSMGKEQLNYKLSQDRAQSTFDYLVAKGVAGSRMIPSGFGESQPLASNDTKEGRLKNRRVELKLYLSN